MGIYSINPQTNVNSQNISNIMTQLINDISNSIQSIINIISQSQYDLMIMNINKVLNDYLKIYGFFDYGLTNIYIQIYNQNIDLISYVNIILKQNKYINYNSIWGDFYCGKYNDRIKIIYNQLTPEEKNILKFSIISGDLYFIDDINFTFDELNTTGILLKPKNNNCICKCNDQNTNQYTYITTLYWN